MKLILYLWCCLWCCACTGQHPTQEPLGISVSPAIDTTLTSNMEVITLVTNFMKTKNASLTENAYWLESDFQEYVYPYQDIYQIEQSRLGSNFYKPTLMELVSLSAQKKLLKVGFVGVHPKTKATTIRAVYTIIATQTKGGWKLQRALAYTTQNWKKLQRGSITYYLPPRKQPIAKEMQAQQEAIAHFCSFFDTEPIPIRYYSCDSPKQVFEIKGFDYWPDMYLDTTGGMAEVGNIVYSGANTEYYMHEIVHVYMQQLFPEMPMLLNEGMAMYVGGSGQQTYTWHRAQFALYLQENTIDLADHLAPFERLYVADETSIPYMIGALICERTYRMYGKQGLKTLLAAKTPFWDTLATLGLTPDNFTAELRKEIEHPVVLF